MPQPYRPPSGRVPFYAGDLLDSERVSATCQRCGHRGEVDLAPWVEREGPDIPMGHVYARLTCSKCGYKAKFPPRIFSPRDRNALSLREIYKIRRRAVVEGRR